MNSDENYLDAMKRIMAQFGDSVPIRKIAQYAQDEFEIPYDMAVMIICDNT